MENITKISEARFASYVKPMDYVSNGIDIGRYLGTTKRGVHVVAWGDKRDDHETIEKLSAYLEKHSS